MAAWYFTRNRTVRNSTFIRSSATSGLIAAGTHCYIVNLAIDASQEITGVVQEDSDLELESGVFETTEVRHNEISLQGVQPDAALKKSRFGACLVTYGNAARNGKPACTEVQA